jgi:hypothetical protein
MADAAVDPLLAELVEMLERADPVPSDVVDAARASFTWRTIDAELAELTADSLLTGAGVRGSDPARLLTFAGPGLEVEVEVAVTGDDRRLTGQLVPTGPAEVSVRWATGSADTVADDLGRFTVGGVPATTVSLAVRRPGAERPVVTSWTAL